MSERTPEVWLLDARHGNHEEYLAALAAWEADRSRIAELTAQRDALAALARAIRVRYSWGFWVTNYADADSALAAIEQEGAQ